jgi:DNA recombination protein RmuC
MPLNELFDFKTHLGFTDWQTLWIAIASILVCSITFFIFGRLTQKRKIRELLKRHQQEQLFFDERLDQLHHSFSSISQQALKANNESFMSLAAQSFERLQDKAAYNLDKKEQQFGNIVKPILDTISKTEQRLSQLEKDRIANQSRLDQHLHSVLESQQALQKETNSLVTALRRPEVRGRWGELTLKRLLELSGMSQHCDFSEQTTTETAEQNLSNPATNNNGSRLRPDVIVQLPNDRLVVIDAKTPLDAYLSATDADGDERIAHLQSHAKQIRQHITQLSQKKYWSELSTSPEFVVMFIPADHFLDSALEHDKNLLEYAIKHRVTLATPSSLISLLRTIELAWNNHTLSENALAIRDSSRSLFERITTLSTHLNKLGSSIDNTVDHYNRLIGSYQRKVVPAANKLSELDTNSNKLNAGELIDKSTRRLSTQEGQPSELHNETSSSEKQA